ncbi:MAG: amidohydrolase [Lachnospiraceae bacterium]|nr:amidohydrolase [Lachnospiraceae bacterium]
MDILIKNCNLIAMSESRELYEENIDILISNNKITKIDRNIETKVDKIIDASSKIVMPGLINTHAHIGMSIFRETIDGYKLKEWLEQKIWPMEDKLTEEDIYMATILSSIEMIKTGTTTINDMYFYPEKIIKAALEMGIRMQTTRTLMNIQKDGSARISELNRLIEEYKDKYNTIGFNVGIHGLYTTDAEYVKKCVDFAEQNNLVVHMHFCENTEEVLDIENKYNKKPIEVLKELILNTKTILAHSVVLNKEDIDELSDMNISISHCPISNLKLGCGIANINYMLEKGINISLGTDGQGSGSNLDMFEVMKFTALLQKGIEEKPEIIDAYEVLKMATINGAKALGLENTIGSIDVGKNADIIIIDLCAEVTQPINNVFASLVYNVKGTNVETSIIDGKIVMENRKLTALVDEKQIFNKAKEIIERIK